MYFVALTNDGQVVSIGEYSDMFAAEKAANEKGINHYIIFDEYLISDLYNELFESEAEAKHSAHVDNLLEAWRG